MYVEPNKRLIAYLEDMETQRYKIAPANCKNWLWVESSEYSPILQILHPPVDFGWPVRVFDLGLSFFGGSINPQRAWDRNWAAATP